MFVSYCQRVCHQSAGSGDAGNTITLFLATCLSLLGNTLVKVDWRLLRLVANWITRWRRQQRALEHLFALQPNKPAFKL